MDETALFWRRGAANTQATTVQAGKYKVILLRYLDINY
jgi:hypothetical protein